MKILRILSWPPFWPVLYALVCILPYMLISQDLQVLETWNFNQRYISVKDVSQNFKLVIPLVFILDAGL